VGEPRARRPIVVLIIAVVVLAAALGAGAFALLQNTRALPAFIQPLFGRRFVHIQGDAMAPTLRAGQIVSVDTGAYAHHPPQHGDIVLFTPPDQSSLLFIKRIVAIPGDQLLITKGTVSINGQVISEPFLPEPWTYNASWPASGQPIIVPANQYFVMGDNRNHSSDSRTFGFVSLAAIQGKLLP
jgi:signal peptidase I